MFRVLLIFCIFAPVARAEDSVELCRAGHAQARGSIARLKCRIVVEYTPREQANPYGGPPTKTGSRTEIAWTQDGDKIHAVLKLGPGTTVEAVWDGAEFKSLKRGKVNQKDIHLDGLIDSSKGLEGLESPWRLGLFGWPDKEPVKLEPPWLDRVEVRQVGGVKYYVAHTNSGAGMPRSETWFAPRYNFLVAKTVLYPDPKQTDIYYVREVTDFAEPARGIYFPRRVTMKRVHQGRETDEGTVAIDQIEVNRSIDPAVFAMTFPPAKPTRDASRAHHP